jgi:hypothetical protein
MCASNPSNVAPRNAMPQADAVKDYCPDEPTNAPGRSEHNVRDTSFEKGITWSHHMKST